MSDLGLNFKSLIQLSKTLPVELIETHNMTFLFKHNMMNTLSIYVFSNMKILFCIYTSDSPSRSKILTLPP